MHYHETCARDKRTRFYLPVKKLLASQNVDRPERIIGNPEYQTVIHYIPEMTVFHPGGSILLDFGAAFHGGIRFNNVCGGSIRVKFGESISETLGNADEDCSRKDATLELPRCGMLEYGNTVFRFVQITNAGTKDLSCLNVIGVALERDLDVAGSFESSDERLNTIWKTAVRTVHLCMQDYLYDGAKRDRIVWMGDMHPEIRGILCAFSDNSIVRDSFEFLMQQAPADQPMNQIYTYSCWFIISLHDYYMATGDLEFLRKHAEYIRLMMETFARFAGPDGAECVPERRFLDWPNNDNLPAKHAGIQALMVWMMSAGTELLDALGLDSAAAKAARKKLLTHVPDPVGRKAPAALMTLTGLADRRDVLETNPLSGVSTFYGFYMLLAKETLPALDLIRRYWGIMLDFGATSFWEDFDLEWTKNAFGIDSFPVPGKKDIHADFGNYCYKGLRHSLSHGWSCGPAPFLSERILGVKFLTPGGSRISVRPDLGDLEYVKGTFPTPRGLLHVEADRSGKVTAEAPAGVEIVR